MLFRTKCDGLSWAAPGRGKWGSLAWPMNVLTVNDQTTLLTWYRDAGGGAAWHHVVQPDDYEVFPYVEEVHETLGIVMQQCGEPEALTKAALRQRESETSAAIVSDFICCTRQPHVGSAAALRETLAIGLEPRSPLGGSNTVP